MAGGGDERMLDEGGVGRVLDGGGAMALMSESRKLGRDIWDGIEGI